MQSKLGWLKRTALLLLAIAARAHAHAIRVILEDDIDDSDDQNKKYASCGDCFCVTKENASCPKRPKNSFDASDDVEILKSQIALNPYTLECDPYGEEPCQMAPPQNRTLVAMGEEAVCGIRYEPRSHSTHERSPARTVEQIDGWNANANKDSTAAEGSSVSRKLQCPTYYNLVSYESFDSAKTDGAVVTHAGACGACSTTKDLAAYLEHVDLTDLGTLCVTEGLVSFERGVECFINHGLTKVRFHHHCRIQFVVLNCRLSSLISSSDVLVLFLNVLFFNRRVPWRGCMMATRPVMLVSGFAFDLDSYTNPTMDLHHYANSTTASGVTRTRRGQSSRFLQLERDDGVGY
mmetsp:Transcript_13394/g.22174  ORF Transcript_13394/g.22174 Transcript_13394/m.22174 type:complete len:349 (+) Transcript_13394:290-1336(+)